MAQMEQVAQHLVQAIENQVDAEIERLEKLDGDDLETLRERRLVAMKKAEEQKREWLQAGHGQYSEVPDEGEFFAACKKSKHLVCHFYRESTFRCKIVDKHLEELAAKHLECRFIKINAEKSKFLVDRLAVRVLPTIVCLTDNKTIDRVVGFDDLGGHDEFSTEMMEWRLAQGQVIQYSGDLTNPPDQGSAKNRGPTVIGKKTVRGNDNEDSSDDDW